MKSARVCDSIRVMGSSDGICRFKGPVQKLDSLLALTRVSAVHRNGPLTRDSPLLHKQPFDGDISS